MSENVIQTSFSSGELSPSIFARVDLQKYHAGAAKMRNFFVDYRSGASTRPGTQFIRPTLQGSGPVRVVRFEQSSTTTYVLEFGNQYLRFISNAGSVTEPAATITNIQNSNPAVVTATNTFHNADLVFMTGVNGMPQANNRYFIVNNVTPSSFQILDGLTDQPVDSTTWGTYVSGGTVARVYTVGTPYLSSELSLLKFSQSGNVMNITHPNHPPQVLTLNSATNWQLQPANFTVTIQPPVPTSVGATPATGGPAYFKYAVTSVDVNGQESELSTQVNANNVIDIRVTAGSINLTWNAASGAVSYNVYGSLPSYSGPVPAGTQWGFIGSTTGLSFSDSNITPDFAVSPPIKTNPFAINASGTGYLHPQVSAYFQQRLVFANNLGGSATGDLPAPATFWMSRTGTPYNFDVSSPIQADDAITGTLVSLEINEIKSMVPMPGGLIVMTTRGAWQINGGGGSIATSGGPVTPSNIVATPQAYTGANDVPPLIINFDIVYVQAKGSIVRDLTYNIYANIFTGTDISLLSNHFFYGHTLSEWAYAEEPFKVVWAVRDDGVLLSMTILKEQDIHGWAQHDTFGEFRSVCSVTEGTNDAVYVVVDRPNPLNPVLTVKSIERFANRTFTFGAEDAWSVDAGVKTVPNQPNSILSFDSPSNGQIAIFSLSSSGSGQPQSVFDSTMIGWILRASGGIARIAQVPTPSAIICTIVQPFSDLIANDPLNRPAPAASGTWSVDQPFTTFYGLDHLEGLAVSVLADGGVVNGLTVQNGSITLPQPVTKVVAGLPFQAQLQTMYLDLGQETNTIQGKRKKIGALTVRVKDSRGLKAGRTFNTVIPIKELNQTTVLGIPSPLITADERIVMDPLWDVPGQICLQVDDPLPATVLGVVPEVVIGDTVR